jgi:pyrroline-5-carboxylate reductase
MKKICFIGGGNMASAILSGLVKAYPGIERHVVEPFGEARDRIAATGAHVYATPVREAIANADVIVLATKPQTLKQACGELSAHLDGELIVSIAAGTTIASIASWLNGKTSRIVRTMPNTPALVGKGITGVFAPQALPASDVETAMTLMRSCGEVLRVADESMIEAAKGVGFSDTDARMLVLATLKGATALAEASDESPATLRERVTSKGGTTAAALAVINERGVKTALIEAVKAARDRGRELGKSAD